MKMYFNGNFLTEQNALIKPDNRAFLYGDGFFETMAAVTGKVKYLGHHLSRLKEALRVFNIDIPEELEMENCAEIVRRLYYENDITAYAKVKIYAWREAGGTYLPLTNKCSLMLKIEETGKPVTAYKQQAFFSSKVTNHWSEISRFKSMSAQNYIYAALEMKDRNADEIIISDIHKNISEGLVSNIFWVKDGHVYTPSLKTGCIEGVSRRVILQELKSKKMVCEEVFCQKADLMHADSIFCTNATGISHLLKIEDKSFTVYRDIETIYQPY